MEVQLQELIQEIKKEGVMAAEAEAKSIIDAAKKEAEKIVQDARREADRLMANAKSENERTVKSGEEALRQAGRNLLISFRESVTREIKAIVSESVAGAYSSEALAAIIIKCVENWAKMPDAENIAVILNEKELSEIESLVLAGLNGKINKGITLKANDNFDGGFRIAVNSDGAYYDYSAEAVVDMLSSYLSPKVVKLLKEA